MFSGSSMTSHWDDCVLTLGGNCTVSEILPTKEVKDGRLRFLGGGGLRHLICQAYKRKLWLCDEQDLTHEHHWIYGVGEERHVLRIWDEVDPTIATSTTTSIWVVCSWRHYMLDTEKLDTRRVIRKSEDVRPQVSVMLGEGGLRRQRTQLR
jgi:hypothetical protein